VLLFSSVLEVITPPVQLHAIGPRERLSGSLTEVMKELPQDALTEE
jgi:hypothetical protein